MPDLPPITLARVGLPDLSLNVAQAGPRDGVPTILLHGFPESHYGWRRQIGPLVGAGHRLVIPDQRGYGESDRPAGVGAYRLDRLAGDVVALADALGHPRFHLVGHDWGAIVAWRVAAEHPDRVARLAVLNGPHPAAFGPYLRRHPGQWWRSAYAGVFQLPRLPEAWLAANDFAVLRRALARTSRPGSFTAADLDRYAADWARPGALTAMLNWYRALRLPLAHPPGRVRPPTLILWGARDHALQSGLALASLERAERASLHWLNRATHWVQHDEAAAVNAALVDFLGGPAGESRGA